MHTEKAVTDRDWFQCLIAFVIVLNISAIGIETDSSCVHCGQSAENLWLGVNSIFATIYVTEFGLKFYHYGFSCVKGVAQFMDFLLVLVAIVDTWILQFVISSHSIRSLSMLRVLRVIRLSRVLKFMTRQTELRLLIQSFRDLYKFLLPLALTMAIIIYFAALVMSAVYRSEDDDDLYPKSGRWSGSEYWGSIPKSMYTFFQISTGDKWAKEIVRPLIRTQPLFLIIFIPYVLVMFFAFKATLIARACDSVIQSGSVAEDRLKAQEKRTHALLENLRSNFLSIKETDDDDCLTYQDLVTFCRIDGNRKLLSSLNLPVSDLGELFYILGGEGKGRIPIDTFFGSILRLSGPGMGRHVTSIQMKSQAMASRAVVAMTRIAALEDKLGNIEVHLSEFARAFGLKNGLKVSSNDSNLITVDILSDNSVSGGLRGSSSSLSLRSRKKDKYRRQKSTPFGSFLIE